MELTGNALMYEQRYQQCRRQERTVWFHGEPLDSLLARLTERLDAPYLPKNGRVLELGCGAGDQGLLLAAAGWNVSGVDVAPTAVLWANEKAKQRGLNADFRVGNVCNLKDFSDESFDLALDGCCLHFVIGADREKFLQSVWRVLKPNGWLLVNTVCGEQDAKVTMPDYDPATRCYVQNGVAYTYQGLEETICREIEAAGFEMVWREIAPAIPEVNSAFLRLDARKICAASASKAS